MKASVFLFLIFAISACQSAEENPYTPNSIEYELFGGTELFNYTGKAIVKELKSGELEIILQLEGPKSTHPYYFLSHLHFGAYDNEDAPLAFLLNPIDMRTLESRTTLGMLSDGSELTFKKINSFNGHIKIHLAPDGPEYDVILAIGNVGQNTNNREFFDMAAITTCSPYGPSRNFSP